VTFTVFLILSLAAFRISRLVIEDTIADPLRSLLLSRYPGKDVEYDPGDKVVGGTFSMGGKLYANEPTRTGDWLAKLISCYWCAGFWVSLLIALGYWLWAGTLWLMLPFALSGATGIVGILMNEAEE